MKYILMMLFILCAARGMQAQFRHVTQVSGVVVATDSLVAMPFVTIYRSSDHRGTYTDYTGYFTLPMQAGDTLNFMSIGLRNSFYVIPLDTSQNHISIVQLMEQDTIMLPTVTIRPYPAPHRLTQELLALDLPGDRYQKFNRSQANAASYDGLYDLANQSVSNERALLNARSSNGFVSGGNLLDASAWKKFMRSLKSGDFDQ